MKKYWLLAGCFFCVLINACKKWDDHVGLSPDQQSGTIMDQVRKVPELSKFAEYAAKTGLDSLLGASKNLTVFAPSNDALAAVPATVVADVAQLKAYLQNHISYHAYFVRDAVDSLRVPLVNGKRAFFIGKKFDDANLTQSDIYLSNGVLHIIDKAIAPRQNIWEFITASKDTYLQNSYIAQQNYLGQDPNLAELDSINPATGEPVYKPGTGIVNINTYKTKVLDVANEDSLFTYIVLTNSTFSAEMNKYVPYFHSNGADTTASNAAWTVVKDLAIRGLYTQDKLPGILESKFGVQVPVNKAAIVSAHQVSNGMVYVMSEANVAVDQKIPAVYVEGEQPYSTNLASGNRVFFRERTNPLTQAPFKDIYVNAAGATRYITYYTNGLVAVKYKVFMMALSDTVVSGVGDGITGTNLPLTQLIKVFNISGSDSLLFDYTATVQPRVYDEVYLGEFTNESYNWLLSYPTSSPGGISYYLNQGTKRIRLQTPAAAVGGAPLNLTLNYLKFVPVH